MCDDSVQSLQTPILENLSERMRGGSMKYVPSYITRVIHRSIARKNLLNVLPSYVKTRGVFYKSDVQNGYYSYRKGEATYKMHDKEIIYRDLLCPGPEVYYGISIFNKLDSWYSDLKFDEISLYKKYDLAAAFGIITAISHNFTDGNGRVSIGLSKTIVDAFTKNKVSLNLMHEILSRNNYKTGLEKAVYSFLPPEENPELNIKNSLTLPCTTLNNMFEFRGLTGIQKATFLQRYYESIIANIYTYRKTGEFLLSTQNEALQEYSFLLFQSSTFE